MVFQHIIPAELDLEKFAEHSRRLFDDACIGNHNDDAAEAARVVQGKNGVVLADVPQCERERSESLSAAGWCGECKQARRFPGCLEAISEQLAAELIDRTITWLGSQRGFKYLEGALFLDLRHGALRRCFGIEMFLGV